MKAKNYLFKKYTTAMMNGVRYNIGTVANLPDNVAGVCTPRKHPARMFGIHHQISEEMSLEAVIHESLHACFDNTLTEKEVETSARDIARLLKRMGWHRDTK